MRRAFTLIELLTVMVISAILMGLIVIPLVQSFNMTRTAQAFSDAQSRARVLTERIAKEIGSAVSVRSTSGLVTTVLNGNAAKVQRHALIVQVPGQDGTRVDVVLPYTKVDLVRPAEGEPMRGPNGGFIDPVTGLEDPTLTAPKGQVVLPVAPGMTVVRYFIALRDPFADYNNPYDGLLMRRNGQQDNLYVLYRAEVQPILPGGQVNTDFFAIDPATGGPLMDDPRFFVPNRDASGNLITNDAHAERIKNWLGQGSQNAILGKNVTRRAVIQTEVSRYDMIQTVYDTRTRVVSYDGNIPRLTPMVQFRPAQVSNEPTEGQVAARLGEETGNSTLLAPDVYLANYGLWDRAIVRNWPRGWNPSDAAANAYNVARGDFTSGDPGAPTGVSIYVYDPDVSPTDYDSGTEVFDMTLYQRLVSGGGRYPFTQAVNGANARTGWLSSSQLRATFVPFTLDPNRGRIITSFGIGEVGDPAVTPPTTNPQNLPGLATSTAGPYSPLNDPDTSGDFWEDKHKPINEKFNKVWVDHPNLQPNVHRYIDLRVTPQADGTFSPLHPTMGFPRATIVPGSEEVYGPDQLPGPNYGRTVRYTRTTRVPGPNQYRINYVDLPEPTNESGAVDYTVIGLTPAELAGFDPNTYDERNFVSAVIQPRYKRGYLQLNSDPNVPLPLGEVLVSYRFQFNGAGNRGAGNREDVFAVDYETRQLINVLLTMRNYPQSSVPNPQTVTLKSTAAVRNYTR